MANFLKGQTAYPLSKGKHEEVSILPGNSINFTQMNDDRFTGVLIYYSISGNRYYKSMFVPKEMYSSWFTDTWPSGGTIYFRVYNNKLEVSVNSVTPCRVEGYQMIY